MQISGPFLVDNDNTEEVGLIDSTRSVGKLCTWGSGQQWKAWLSTSHNNTLRL